MLAGMWREGSQHTVVCGTLDAAKQRVLPRELFGLVQSNEPLRIVRVSLAVVRHRDQATPARQL